MKLDLTFVEVFNRPIEAVWAAITDSTLLARWLMDNDFEPRVGHKFTMKDPPSKSWRGFMECEVLVLEPPRKMVWSWDGGKEGETPSRITFELTAETKSRTRLVFRHEGEATRDIVDSLRAGWPRKLGVLHDVVGLDYASRAAFSVAEDRVFDALTTIKGLRGWWTPDVTGSEKTKGKIRLEFAGTREHIILKVEEAKRASRVRFACVEHSALSDWHGTELTFDLAARGLNRSELVFRHKGLTPKLPCYGDCQAGWDYFLSSLVAYAETGKGTPFGSAGRAKAVTKKAKVKDPVAEKSPSKQAKSSKAKAPDPAAPSPAFASLVSAFAKDPNVEVPAPSRRAFGSNGIKVRGKIFAMWVRGALVLKLPSARVAAIVEGGGGAPFDAGKGRPMKEWLVVKSAERTWLKLAREAFDYVAAGALPIGNRL